MAFPLGRIIVAAALSAALGTTASFAARDMATPAPFLSAAELLERFDLIVFTDVVTNARLKTPALIGGNLAGEGATLHGVNRAQGKEPILGVGGDVTGGAKRITSHGDAAISGILDAPITLDGDLHLGGHLGPLGSVEGGEIIHGAVALMQPELPLLGLSSRLAGLAETSEVSVDQDLATITPHPDVDGLAVINIPDGQVFFAAIRRITIASSEAKSIIVNVGSLVVDVHEIHVNPDDTSILWNFHEAQSIHFHERFLGGVLAPRAAVVNTGTIEGVLVSRSLIQHGAFAPRVAAAPIAGLLPIFDRWHPSTPSAIVPEPGTLSLVTGGLAAFAFMFWFARLSATTQ